VRDIVSEILSLPATAACKIAAERSRDLIKACDHEVSRRYVPAQTV